MPKKNEKALREHIAALLKEYRQLNGLTQREMAGKIGSSMKSYQKHEEALTKPGYWEMAAFCKLSGLSIEDITHDVPRFIPKV